MSILNTLQPALRQPAITAAPWLINHPLFDLQHRPHMNCDVIFGSPSADCRGTGVCKITARKSNERARTSNFCQGSPAIMTKAKNGNGIEVLLLREHLCINALRRHLSGSTFIVNEPYPLPAQIVGTLNLAFDTLLPGHYPIEKGEGWFKIHFSQSHHFITN
jgi:hypothetical protein